MNSTESATQPKDVGTAAVAAHYGTDAKTVLRWMTAGVTIAGRKVLLRSVRAGKLRKTCWEWVEEFQAACDEGQPPTAPETPAAAERYARKRQAEVLADLRNRKKKG